MALTQKNKLMINDQLLASNATSCYSDGEVLFYTTLANTLHVVSLFHEQVSQLIQQASSPATGESVRQIERGARIIRAHGVHLVLQMPRGNLETIVPRALVLRVVRKKLDHRDYRAAFLLLRTHRIDMNLLVDHNQSMFLENIHDFINQLQQPDYLNLFLSSLRNQDVTLTLYQGIDPRRMKTISNEKSDVFSKTKVNTICDAIREALSSHSISVFYPTILTAYARKQPAEIECALRVVQSLESTIAEDALTFLIFLVDVTLLYNVALGMYDLELTLCVAQHTQKDPKEYLTFLAEIQHYENTYYQRFKIDDSLRRYEKAFSNLALAGKKKQKKKKEIKLNDSY